MKSVKVTCLVLLVGLTCVGLALVAAAPGQQAPATQPSAASAGASNVPAPSSPATQLMPTKSAAPAAPGVTPADTQPASVGSAAPATPAATRPVLATSASPSTSRSPGPVGADNPAAAPADQAVQSNWQALQQQAKAADAALGISLNAAYPPPGSSGAADPEVQKWLEDAYKAETEQAQLLAKYAQTTDAKQKTEIKAELANVLQRQFDLQLQQREREVSEIEARVRNLREMIEKRKTARQSIVTNRLDQVLNELDGMGWVEPSAAMSGPYGPGRMSGPGVYGPRTGYPGVGYSSPFGASPAGRIRSQPAQPTVPSSTPAKSPGASNAPR